MKKNGKMDKGLGSENIYDLIGLINKMNGSIIKLIAKVNYFFLIVITIIESNRMI